MKKVFLLAVTCTFTLPADIRATAHSIEDLVYLQEPEQAEQKICVNFSIIRHNHEVATSEFTVIQNKNGKACVRDAYGNEFRLTLRVNDFSDDSITCEYFLGELNYYETITHDITFFIGHEVELPVGYSVKLVSITPL